MTLAQMRLALREGGRVEALRIARTASATRSAMWSSPEEFASDMKNLKG